MINRIYSTLCITIIFIIFISGKSFSQFGINKVQYEKFTWKYIESKHFDIYYHGDASYQAHFAAVEAENALQSIQSTLNYKLAKRVSFIIYNSHNEFQQTNIIGSYMPEGIGGVTELFKNRIVVPYPGNWEQFRHVIHHELTHAVLNDMFYGGTIQTAIASGKTTEIPLWMNEGLAEFEGKQGYDVQTDMFMRDVSQSEYLEGLEYLDGYFAYRGGQAFYWYVAEKYGKEKISDLINRLRIQGSAALAFKSTFNMSLEDFSEMWVKDMKKYYWPDIEKFKSPEDYAHRLTNHVKDNNFYNSSPAISPNGQKMAFISDKGGTFRIFVRSIEKKDDIVELVGSLRAKDFEELNILTPGISWDPKGTKLAVSAKAGGEDAVYIVDAKSGNYEKLLFGLKSITSVNWSPDGKELVFVGIANEKSDLFLYDLSTKSLSKLTDDIFSDANPVWAPSSKKVYYVSDRADNLARNLNQNNYKIWDTKYNASDIYSIDIKTKDIKRITSDPEYQKTSIAVSPDESKLLYVSDKNGIGNIYEINLSTGKIRPKTNTLNAVTQLSLSPDGSKLLFTSQIHGGYDIFLIEYPFDKYLPSDTLPLTKFRDKMMQKNQLVANIKKSADSSASDSSNKKLTSYGDFDIEFSRQQVVKPNPDAERQYDTKDIVSGKMDNNDTTFIAHDYIIKFSPDLILTNYMYSTYWASQAMGQMMFSDVMGDHLIYIQANLWTDLKNSTFLVSYSYLPLIIDYTFTAFHSAGITYAIGSPGGIYGAYLYRFRKYGASLLASYPFDLFNRVEWGLSLINASKENLDLPQANDFISHNLLLPEGRYVHDNALWGLFGPMRGSRYMVEFKGTPKLSNSSVGFIDINADLRNYIPITSYMSFAVRFSAGKSFGPDPQFYYMGGEENWINARFKNGILPFSRPEDFVMMEMPMPLRGFAVSEVAGTQYFLTNAELRFPLFRALLAGPVPLLIQGIMGSFFFDMGGAWSGSLTSFKATIKDIAGNNIANDLLMSTGIGIRCYFLGLPLKIDVAWRNEYYAWSDPYWNFALGYDW